MSRNPTLDLPNAPPSVRGRRIGRSRFFLGLSGTLLLIVLAGFAPTLFLRPFFDVRPMPAYLFLHGGLLTLWFVWLLVQAVLVDAGRTPLHRRLGMAGAALAAVIVVFGGLLAQLGKPLQDQALGIDIESRIGAHAAVFWINTSSLLVFVMLVAAAVALRHRAETHKRLMLLASINLMAPVFGRFPRWPIFGGLALDAPARSEGIAATAGVLLLMLTLVVYDLLKDRRLHPATIAGCSCVVLMRAGALALAASALGQQIARGSG